MTALDAKYFIVLKTDLTKEMMCDCGGSSNLYELRESLDGTKVVLKYCCCAIPADLYIKGYTPYDQASVISYLSKSASGFTASEELI